MKTPIKDKTFVALVDHVELVKPTLVFSFYFDHSISFSGHLMPAPLRPVVQTECDLVSRELAKNEINFSFIDDDSLTLVFVEDSCWLKVKKISEESDLNFWKKWIEATYEKTLS